MLLLHQDEKETLYSIVFSFIAAAAYSQQQTTTINGYMVPVCVYKGDTIPAVQLPNVYIFRPLKFKNEKERREYYRLVRNVKKTLPLAREINRAVIETYEYIETLPDKKPGKAPETRREGTKRAIYTDYEEINLFTG